MSKTKSTPNTSKPQTRIFRTGRLGCRMAHNRRRNPSNGVQTCICRHPGGRRHCPCCTSVYYSLFFCFFDRSLLQDERDPIFNNIFDALPTVSRSKKVGLANEITRYLSAPTEATLDPLVWWMERKGIYPRLSRMALDYLSIPGQSFFFFLVSYPKILFSNIS